MPDARRLHRQHEVERELPAVVALQFTDPEGERSLELGQEYHAGALVQPSVQPQDPKARAVVQGGRAFGAFDGRPRWRSRFSAMRAFRFDRVVTVLRGTQ